MQRTNVHQTHQTSLNPLDYTMCGVLCFKHFTNLVKAKDHPRAKSAAAANLWWLATNNNQQSHQWRSQTSECLHFGRWWTL